MSEPLGRTLGDRWTTAAFLAAILFSGLASALHAQMHSHGMGGTQGSPAIAAFDRSTAGLPSVQAGREVTLADGASFELAASPVKGTIAGRSLRLLAYNGSVPGPLLRVKQGSSITVRFANRLELDSSVHWHGVRVENRYDGVPGVTQELVGPGGSFTYRLRFPDAGLYWYHPHFREDMTQELGLYGGILVEPAAGPGTAGGWPAVDREAVVFLDDILLGARDVEPFLPGTVNRTMSGRFGNTFLVNGLSEWKLDARQGERVRLYLANVASTRVFQVSIEDHVLKVVGSDGGRAARETLASSVVLGPSERAIVEVLFQGPGTFRLRHSSPSRTVTLGSIAVARAAPPSPAVVSSFFTPGGDEGVAREAAALLARAPSSPDWTLALHMEGGMGGMGGMMDMGPSSPIEWEEDGHMAMMNAMSTSQTQRWVIHDRASGRQGMDIPLAAAVGQVKLLRIVNEAEGGHPMQHPVHLHGVRFLVASRDGQADGNPVWKDTVLIPAGSTYDLLVPFDAPGTWLLHCHIPEHMEAGMMAAFTVRDRD